MFTTGELLKGSFWPETVEVKKCERVYDTYYLLETLGRKSQTYYQMLLEIDQLNTVNQVNKNTLMESRIKDARDLQHYLQYYALKADQKHSASRSLGSNQILPLPHQIDAVYHRMLQLSQVRFLLADDPGSGKTIMSGMLIRELKARKSANRILILVPPLVLYQWQDELKEKFNEEFTIINRAVLEALNGQNPFEHYSHTLASLYWASRDEVREYILEADFDLVIVDEAHKMAAYTHGKKQRKVQRTRLYRLGESLLRNVSHCLLLTATPHKGDAENFRHLLRLLDQDVFSHVQDQETIREKSNPYVIRRLKESMTHFDGSPIFPKRTTKTIGFELSVPEVELYEAVTSYVEKHFNRAITSGSNSTAFAMMVLQRRLSSSLEAIHLSLLRRRERLEVLYHESITGTDFLHHSGQDIEINGYEELSANDQSIIEEESIVQVNTVDSHELKEELSQLEELLKKSSFVREGIIERKYLELENTLFGPGGLIDSGEKVLIFTEFRDTLNYLYECLSEIVPTIAIISGEYSIERRRQQVELFRNKAPIMLATDAGGESINLQFCNQLINFDIPWNPNRLEQRMGRIHRIGQTNEVLAFNLVAKNTREGDVLNKVLTKIEQMREDLGQDLVYDFIGDILEDENLDLSKVIQQAVVNRENPEERLGKLDYILSSEHERLLKLAQSEQLSDSGVDLTLLREEQQRLSIQSLPPRSFANFVMHAIKDTRIKIHQSSKQDTYRIDRFPSNIKDFARERNLSLKQNQNSVRFTTNKDKESPEAPLIQSDHPLVDLAMALTEEKLQSIMLQGYQLIYPVEEKLIVEVFEVAMGDGTDNELFRSQLFMARRGNGEIIKLDPYWLFQSSLTGAIDVGELNEDYFISGQAIKEAELILRNFKKKQEGSILKKQQFLRRVFEAQYENLLHRLSEARQNNFTEEKPLKISRLKDQLSEVEKRREERLEEVRREKSVFLKPLKKLTTVELIPVKEKTVRIIPDNWLRMVIEYENRAGRKEVESFDALGLIDFSSKNSDDGMRYIILVKDGDGLSKERLDDLKSIKDMTYLYFYNENAIKYEIPLTELITS